MRNLKKILALVLALVMSLSLMATANAFTDDASIDATYDEAVTVLSNLQVFQGYDDGSFQPKGSITRAEVAAIIYRIATGDVADTQVDIYADYNKFSDVKSTSWYAGYVNYCANAEYIKGYDDKTFGPNDPVTGYQALAMILRAVGYDVNGEFTGSSWQVKVASTANQLGLTRNVSAGTLNTAATREVVAEVLFRTIAEAYVVEYTTAFGYQPIYLPGSSNNNGSAGNLSGNIARATLGFQTFGLELTEGEITAVGRTAGTTTLRTISTAANGTTETPVIVTGTSTPWTDIGYQAYVYTVPTVGVKTREAVSDLVVTGESLKVTTDGTEYAAANVVVENGARLYYNGEYIGNILVGANGAITNPVNGQIYTYFLNKDGLRGVKVDYIDNDNGGNAEVVVVTEYTVANVLAVTTDTTTTGTNGSYETRVYMTDDNNVSAFAVGASVLVTSDELAVGDWVTYVEYPWTTPVNTTGDFYVTEAPATSAKYSARILSAAADTVYTIGGSNYFISDLEYVTDGTLDNGFATNYLKDNTNQSKDVTIYTDPYGYIVMAQATAATNSYLYVISNAATNPNTGLTEAVVALSDGTISTVQIANLTVGNENTGYIYAANALVGMYTYSTNTAGNYVLNTQQSRMTAASYTTKTATISGTVSNVAAPYASSRKVDLATVVVDLRNYTVGATSAPVYTGYNEIPTVQNTVIWVNTGDANAAVAVGFLLQNSNTIKQDFIVYQTTDYRQVIADIYNQTTSYTMDVLVGDTVSEDYALTIGQFADIQKYGVGIYSFISNDGGKTFTLVKYTSFDEVWGDATWGTGVITWKGQNYTYDSQNLVVIDVASRQVTNNLSLVWGRTTHAYIANAGKSNQIVYAILGTEAPASTQVINGVTVTVTHPTQRKDATDFTYNVATGFITVINDKDARLYDVTVNGKPSSWVDLPDGTKITLPQTTGNGATQQEYVKIEVAGQNDQYLPAGASFEVKADTAITTGYYAFQLDGKTYYAPAKDANAADDKYTATDLITVAQGQGYTAPTGTFYKYTWSSTSTGEKIVSTTDAASDTNGYLNPATYDVAEVTTGYFSVELAGTATKVYTVTAGALCEADGTVAYDADSETTAPAVIPNTDSNTYYALAGTKVICGAGTDADGHWTVDNVDVTITRT